MLDHRLTAPEPPEAVAARLTGRAHRDARPARQVPDRRARRRRGAARHLRMTGNLLLAGGAAARSRRASCAPRALLDDGSYLALHRRPPLRHLARRRGRRRGLLAGKLGPEPLGRAGRPRTWRARSRAARRP